MKNEFTAVIERDSNWYVAYCPEIEGANGQGKSKEEARNSLTEKISLILRDHQQTRSSRHVGVSIPQA